jgi:hypothetical protein
MLVLIHRVVSAGSRKMAIIVLVVMTLIAVECLIFCFSVIFLSFFSAGMYSLISADISLY